MPAQRTLIVVRHAKSDWSTDGLPDHDRPLVPRGRRDAPAIGTWLSANAGTIGLVVCSPATRARQTWQLAGANLTDRPEVRYDDRMYGAGPTALLTIIAELPDELAVAALVGHNPGLADLVEFLSGEPREMKTAAVAVISWPGCWADAESREGSLEGYATPRG
jgi:phosphohistidine phosphatase